MTRTLFLVLLLFGFSSCNKRLKEFTIKTADIEVTKYEISQVSTVHDFVEVRKGNLAITVLEANSYGFADLFVKHDTIVIQYLPNIFYKTADKAFNYKIKLDTTISVEYWRQKVSGREK
ncbi:MAG: hypothetical protein EOP53_19025 [Sphingobacteriales bacterium]|nr:MAG: hypothetical protein EOP53_19025 [Sphingobacteriales bacterium]